MSSNDCEAVIYEKKVCEFGNVDESLSLAAKIKVWRRRGTLAQTIPQLYGNCPNSVLLTTTDTKPIKDATTEIT